MLKNTRKYRIYYSYFNDIERMYDFFDIYTHYNLNSNRFNSCIIDEMYKYHKDLYDMYKRGNLNIMQVDLIK